MPDQTVTPTPETHAVIHPLGIGPVAVPHESLGNPDHLDALAKTVSEHPAYKDARASEAPTAPEISDAPDYSALNIPVPELTAEGAIENHPDFKQAVQKAWDLTQRGRLPQAEAGFTVDRDGTPSHVNFEARDDNRGSVGSLHQNITKGDTVLALHVHGADADAAPSQHDKDIARQTGIPFYVQSRAGLFAVAPNEKVTQIYDDPNWMSAKPKKKK